MPSPSDGAIESIAVQAGATVQVGTILGVDREGAGARKACSGVHAQARAATGSGARAAACTARAGSR